MRTIIKNNKKYAVIANETDLLDFSYIVASGVTAINAILTADIDLNPGLDPKKQEDRNNCRIWVPIGITIGEKRSYSYEGEFLGNGYKISGIYTGNFICDEENQGRLYHIAQPTSNQHTRAYSMFGLFAQLGKNAQIKNLAIDGYIESTEKYTNYVGGICGRTSLAAFVLIDNCTNYADIKMNCGCAGGICGTASFQYTLIKNCKNYGTIEGPEYTSFFGKPEEMRYYNDKHGGIVGEIAMHAPKSGYGALRYENMGVVDCKNFGKILGDPDRGGEIAGRSFGIIRNCTGRQRPVVAINHGVVDMLDNLLLDDLTKSNYVGEYAVYKFFVTLTEFLCGGSWNEVHDYIVNYGASARIAQIFESYMSRYCVNARDYKIPPDVLKCVAKYSKLSTAYYEIIYTLLEIRAFRDIVNEDKLKEIIYSKSFAEKACRRYRKLKAYDFVTDAANSYEDFER